MKKIIVMVILCFSLSSITVEAAKQEQLQNTKVPQNLFDGFMHDLFAKDILDSVEGFYKDDTMSVSIQDGVELSADKEGRFIMKFIVLPHSKLPGKKGKTTGTDTITFRVDPYLLGTESNGRKSAITFLNLEHNDPTKQN
ncbi:hypothetical protein [Bacillus atrophaeus]|uniref:DUF3888 domain-containing protein n=1 Tax=Bacillus atrophaeus (strain 1942) TaxID=720555 RepID=A0ABN3Z920_BACA1|nr:hypothetical protein [Bacillus atrophaeus]AMR62725.1 hypothetical protein A1D11_10085 [Bacillus subtilis subsp. globigii]ADP32404.1 hypothetical protein BATR1942_07270 [Bacillus atrophaeus 1942]AIK45466.1 hypothetical protein DJ95_1356 [Bacillus atrophaeus subsp. globigii]EIM11636.1 hypothetical protein UY9_06097 [Bacillus atrophaeus C89]KFK84190.1 hypothetical protein DK44_2280 [Bacillus atrophaeus]